MSAHSDVSPAERSMPFVLKVVLGFVFWTVVGLFFTSQLYFLVPDETTWIEAMQSAMPRWYIWGLLTPFILYTDHRLPAHWSLARRLRAHIPLSLAWLFAFLLLRLAADLLLHGPPLPDLGTFFLRHFYWDLLIYWLIVGIQFGRAYHTQLRRRERETADLALKAARLESDLTTARLRALQAQLNPHFLFNTLNTIADFTDEDPRAARRMMDHLGRLLRFSLDTSGQQEIPLAEELAATEHYLAIERARFEDRLTVEVDVAPAALDALVPGLLLQPLVENAIRHGLTARAVPVHVGVSAAVQNDTLRLRITDDGAGLPEAWRFDTHAGVGLRNTASRLAHLYKEAHTFRVGPNDAGGVCVEVVLPFRPRAAVAERSPSR